jgi:uncharacterized protein (DUF2267 family)
MSAVGLEVFDRTIHASTVWVDDVMHELRWMDRHKAYHALRAVLHALRDRLPVNTAVHLAAQFPMLIRGMYFEGWQPEKTPVRERHQDQFLTHVTEAFLFDTDADSYEITTAVLRVLDKHVSEGEIEKVKMNLPAEIRELWS